MKCFEDTAEIIRFLSILHSEALFCMVFSGKYVSLVALLEELLFSLGCNVSEILGKSI